MQKVFLVCIIILCIFIAPYAKAQYIFAPDDYAVYATVLDKWHQDKEAKLIIIRGYTALHTLIENLEAELKDVFDRMPDLSYEALIDFKAKNKDSYLIKPLINQKIPYKLISQEEVRDFFGDGNGWEYFYNKHPHSKGIFTFSRVGFNSRKSQALVCIANQWGRLSGTAAYIFLTKQENGTWTIAKELPVWSSWSRERR